jgi:hypothetical protein
MDGFKLTIWKTGLRDEKIVLVIDGEGRIPPQLVLESARSRVPAELQTRDLHFDLMARVAGSEDTALAVLDHDTRAAVLRLLEGGGSVSGGLARLPRSSLREATASLPWLISIANRLCMRPGEVPVSLARNAFHDPFPEVRVGNFKALQQHYQGSEIAVQAIEQALESKHGELRFEAAVLVRDRGKDVLRQLALADDVELSLRVGAVEQLIRASWASTTVPLLVQLLDCDATELRRIAVTGLGRYRHQPAVARLMELADGDTGTVREVAVALGRIGDQQAEPLLIDLLDHHDPEVVIVAAAALARAGTTAAVMPLLEHTGRSAPKSLAKVAKTAIARIQSRVTGAEQGQLSIAPDSQLEGGLSQAAEAGEGSISLVNEEPQTAEDV